MPETPSRREVLLSFGAGASAGLAGCALPSGSDGEASASCSSFGFSNTRTAPLSEASVGLVPPDRRSEEGVGHVELRVSLDRTELESGEAAVINVYNPYDEVQNPRYTIPLAQGEDRAAIGGTVEGDSDGTVVGDGRVTKTARIGDAPVSGEFRVVVEDSAGDELAAERFSFDCKRPASSELGS